MNLPAELLDPDLTERLMAVCDQWYLLYHSEQALVENARPMLEEVRKQLAAGERFCVCVWAEVEVLTIFILTYMFFSRRSWWPIATSTLWEWGPERITQLFFSLLEPAPEPGKTSAPVTIFLTHDSMITFLRLALQKAHPQLQKLTWDGRGTGWGQRQNPNAVSYGTALILAISPDGVEVFTWVCAVTK